MRTYKRKPGRVNPDKRMARAVDLRAEGLSLRQIAERLSCSFSTVRNDLARWEQEHANVVQLCKTSVQNAPPGGEECTPELHSTEPSNVIELRLATRRHA
jgi:hypothetical protein